MTVAALVVWSSLAFAGSRKRIVVLDFEGPKAEKFHDDIVKLLKKSHTVVPTDKWNGAADELDAAKVTEKNVKKVAKKLKIDGVVTGKIEKRRDEYIIRLKLRAGTSGELVGNSIDTKADGPRLDGKAQGELKDELIGQIDDLESNHGGGDDDEADKPSKKKKHGDDDGDDEADSKPSKKKKGGDDDGDDEDKHSSFSKKNDDDMKGGDKVGKKSKKSDDDEDADTKPKKTAKKSDDDADAKPKKGKKSDDDDEKTALSTKHDDDESPLPKSTKKRADKSDKADKGDDDSGDEDSKPKKKTARKDDDDESSSVEASSDDGDGLDSADALSPANRAIDVSAGLSFTGRNLGFVYKSALAQSSPPPGYKQAIPVAGGMFDATFYPLAFNKKNTSITRGLGLEILYDKAIKINSQKRYTDNAGAGQVANLTTSESRFKLAAVFRYPLGKTANAPVVGGRLGYQTKRFSIAQTLPNNDATDVPNVYYKMITPEAFFIYPASPKLNFNVNAGFLAITDTGDIQKSSQYGPATVSGFEFSAGLDYNVTKNIFVRGEGMLQTIGFTFKGDPMSKANTRDNDPTSQDVTGARDTYFGGAVTLGYIY